jgi:hypothetical protein
MTTQTLAEPKRQEIVVQDMLVVRKIGKAAPSLLPLQFNDAYMAAFLINVRLGNRA